ncbi:MAG: response regulator [Lachnospiraceae bacterium]|nr:response regulator [Lachnospiraceae bacterium]
MIDEQNLYHRSWAFMVCYATPLVVLVILLTVICQYYKEINKDIRISLLLFTIAPFAGSLIQFFIYGLSITDIFIVATCVMLFVFVLIDLNRAKELKEKIEQKNREQMEIISTLANIYNSMHELDLEHNTYRELRAGYLSADEILDNKQMDLQQIVNIMVKSTIDPSCIDEDLLETINLSTIDDRMHDTDIWTKEVMNPNKEWKRGRIIVSKRGEDGKIARILWVTEDIDKERRERERLIDASERAVAASEAKSAFLSNMSHEIRTPINAVLGMNEMILRECDDEIILGYSESIRTAGSTLLGLVNDILDFSKIEAGKMEIIPVDYDLSSVINDLVNMIRMKADAKGIKLEFEISKEVPKQLHGDEVRIKQIVTNILTNAVKYTEKGSVTLCVDYEKIPDEEDSIMLDVAVKDTGIGIKKEDMKKLFSEFDRIEEKRNRNVEGTGLGMSITKHLLEMMGSALEVESIYGVGSRFSFRLKQTVIEWEELGDYEAAYKAAISSREKYHEKFHAPEAEILVVDDTPMNLVVFTNLLKQTGIRIDTASSGEEALSLSFDKKYDMIFLDHMMPDMDGIETLHKMKARENDPNTDTPVICLTANAVSGARKKYLSAGFDDYLTKPIDSVKLENMLIDFLPEDKVLRSAGDGLTSMADETQQISADAGTGSRIPDFIGRIDEIDLKTGINNCGNEAAYLETVKLYAGMVKDQADEIQRLWESGDIKGATIRIHALKSSSRIIGATDLGELAQELENAGNEGDTDKLGAEIGNLLDRCKKIGEELSPLIPEDEPDDSDLTPIDKGELKELYTAIGEFLSVSDYDSAIDLIEALKAYGVPDEEKERRRALINAADEVRYEDIGKIIAG